MEHVGQEIRRIREAKGWSQAKLAVEAGMGTSALSQIENNKRNASSRSLLRLARALDVEVADLFPKAQALLFASEEERRIPRIDKMGARRAILEYFRLKEEGKAADIEALYEGANMDVLLAAQREVDEINRVLSDEIEDRRRDAG
jgi:transcriptional regulator with XRE-family HTH domain